MVREAEGEHPMQKHRCGKKKYGLLGAAGIHQGHNVCEDDGSGGDKWKDILPVSPQNSSCP
jgi:hypothetical protein